MLYEARLNVNDDLPPCIIKYDEEKEDFIINLPKEITRADLVDAVEEIKRLTEWQD